MQFLMVFCFLINVCYPRLFVPLSSVTDALLVVLSFPYLSEHFFFVRAKAAPVRVSQASFNRPKMTEHARGPLPSAYTFWLKTDIIRVSSTGGAGGKLPPQTLNLPPPKVIHEKYLENI